MVQSTEYHGGYSYLISNTNEDLGITGQIGPTYLSLKIVKCRYLPKLLTDFLRRRSAECTAEQLS